MNLDERTRLARLAYIRAVALVRTNPVAESWARLRAAAQDLNRATLGARGEPGGVARDDSFHQHA